MELDIPKPISRLCNILNTTMGDLRQRVVSEKVERQSGTPRPAAYLDSPATCTFDALSQWHRAWSFQNEFVHGRYGGWMSSEQCELCMIETASRSKLNVIKEEWCGRCRAWVSSKRHEARGACRPRDAPLMDYWKLRHVWNEAGNPRKNVIFNRRS